jgi:mRNA interferase MazF
VTNAKRGEVWMADFDPVVGHEQAGKRPAIVISADVFNRLPVGLVVVVPFTTTDRNLRLHVAIEPPDGGLRKKSFAMTEQVRCLSTKRFIKRLGRVSADKLAELEAALEELLALYD